MYFEKMKEAFLNQSVLNKNLSWFFEIPFLLQFCSARLVIHFSHLMMYLEKVEEVFVLQWLRNKNLFHFSEMSFPLLGDPLGSRLLFS